MNYVKNKEGEGKSLEQRIGANYSRRKFFAMSGIAIGSGLLLDSCKKEEPVNPGPDDDGVVNLGSGDIGILNYAFALEQLEAAFYTEVLMSPYANMTSDETDLLIDIRDHEIAHREFFRNALGDSAIPDLEVDFSRVDFNRRDSVLSTAKVFEDLGVSAYNGAGKLITSPDYLLIAGKIVSVEARHAGYIRDLLANGSFADGTVVDANGLDTSNDPATVLAAADPYIKTQITGKDLPTS